MKVAHAQQNVLGTRGVQETASFNIAATPHAFKILSSGMYSDKVRAVLRELGCNAADAHIAAGCPNRPFRVKIPNDLDDQFYVQDWGTGLSHDEVMHLYTTYFASTKQASDDFTGGFGLGSKSPFAYTTQFSVVSAHGGKKRTYSLYLSNTGAPNVSLMTEEDADADWPTGLRVGFAVNPVDIPEFEAKAKVVYRWFRTPPEMRGTMPIESLSYRFTCSEFGLLRDESLTGDVPVATMGNVCYPLALPSLDIKNLPGATKGLVDYAAHMPGLVLFLPIGAAQMTASREHLEYDPKTKKGLRELLSLAVRRAGKETVEALEAIATEGWEARCKARKLVENLLPGSKYQFAALAKSLGVSDESIKVLTPFVTPDHAEVPFALGGKARVYLIKRSSAGQRNPTTYGPSSSMYSSRLEFRPKTAIFTGFAKYAIPRVKAAIAAGTYDQAVVVMRPVKDKKTPEADILAAAYAVSKNLSDMEVKRLDSLPEPVVAPGTGKKRRGKNWVPTLPVGENYDIQAFGRVRAGELGTMTDNLFACHRELNQWRNKKSLVRIYEKTADEDRDITEDAWDTIWLQYSTLQKAVALSDAPTECAVVSASDIKRIGLIQLGWRNGYYAIREYLERPELRDALAKSIKRRHIMAAENPHEIGEAEIFTGLAWYLGKSNGRAKKEIESMLKDKGLLDDVIAMAKARADQGRGPATLPPPVLAYQGLVSHFGLANQLAGDIQQALTVEDANASFHRRFPLSALIDAQYLFNYNLGLVPEAVQFILSKE